jgi:hypothetical protein
MSEVTSLQKFQEEENKKLKQISDMEGVDLGVARTMLDQSRNPTFPTLDQPVKTRQDWMNEVLLFDRQRAQQQSQPRQVSRPDFLAQARQEVRPQFDRAVGQLTQQVEGTRRQLPQQLASRGQALGGLRGQQEDTLTRDLAYGTADLQAQGEMAALQRADVLGQRYTEEQRYQDEVAFRERSFEEQQRMNQFSMQTTLQQLANEQDRFDYQQTRDALGDEWRQIEFDENVRAKGVQEAIQQAQLGIQQAQLGLQARGVALSERQYADSQRQTAEGVDTRKLAPYMSMLEMYLNNQDEQGALAYIDNLSEYGLTPQETNYIKGIFGYQGGTSTVSQVPTAQAIQGATGQTGVRTPTVPVRTTTQSRFIMPNAQVSQQTGASLKDIQTIDELIINSVVDPTANPTAVKNQIDSLYISGALGTPDTTQSKRLLGALYLKYGLTGASTEQPATQPTGGGTTAPRRAETGSR